MRDVEGEREPWFLLINHHQIHQQALPTKKYSIDLVALRWTNDEPKVYASIVMRFTTGDTNVNASIDFYILTLNGVDVVLGVNWLQMLSPILCDLKAKTTFVVLLILIDF